MNTGIIPGQAGLVDLDEDCAHLDLPRATVEESPQVVVNSNSGFGGGNVCHVFAHTG